jgi:hypothetical protein
LRPAIRSSPDLAREQAANLEVAFNAWWEGRDQTGTLP